MAKGFEIESTRLQTLGGSSLCVARPRRQALAASCHKRETSPGRLGDPAHPSLQKTTHPQHVPYRLYLETLWECRRYFGQTKCIPSLPEGLLKGFKFEALRDYSFTPALERGSAKAFALPEYCGVYPGDPMTNCKAQAIWKTLLNR